MIDIFSNLELDKQSFWLGFLAGAIFIWLLNTLRRYLPGAIKNLRQKYLETKEGLASNAELKYRNEILYSLQRLHLTSVIFSLDEIVIKPRLLAIPNPVNIENESKPDDIVNQTIPYLPDWPELAAKYNAPTISLTDALSKGASLILIGQPGSGRTVALAQLASMVLRKEIDLPDYINALPIYFHAQEISSLDTNSSPIENVVKISSKYLTLITQQRVPALFQNAFEKNRVLLLIDGLDEISRDQYQITLDFLKSILEKYPQVKIIVATSPTICSGLFQLGLIPVFLASWNEDMALTYLRSFSRQWKQYIQSNESLENKKFEGLFIRRWLESYSIPQNPLEFTLKVWAAFAGDILGPDIYANLETFIRRASLESPDRRNFLEQIATRMILDEKLTISQDDILLLNERKITTREPSQIETDSFSETVSESVVAENHVAQNAVVEESTDELNIPRLLKELSDIGLLVSQNEQQYRFSHPYIACYLAGNSLAKSQDISYVLDQHDWTGKLLTISNYLHFCENEDKTVEIYLGKEDFLYKKSLTAVRWLIGGKTNSMWQSKLMRHIATKIQEESITLGLSGRFLTALSLINDPHIGSLFRKFLNSEEANIRQLAALGCGLIKDIKSIPDIAALINDPIPGVSRAACLALAAIGNKNALETLATVLFQGSEMVKRYAAEALANHKEEGHPALRDASNMDDLLVRRAVVFGLARIDESWATEILEKTQLEDQQWLVRNAAIQVIEDLKKPKSWIPMPSIPLTDAPWLIEFASKLGIGVVPGKPAVDLLIRALRDGEEDLRLIALDYLRLNGILDVIPTIIEVYQASLGEVREAAFNALWYLSAAGFEIKI